MGFDSARAFSLPPASSAPAWRVALLTALAYVALGQLGLLLAIPPGGVTLLWPPAGGALAAAIRIGRPGLAGVALGAFALAIPLFVGPSGGFTIPVALGAALVFSAIATLQAALACGLVRRALGYPYSAATPLSLAAFFFFGGVVPGFVGAALDNLTMLAFGKVTGAELISGLAFFWMGDVTGSALFGAALLAFDGPTVGACLKRAAPVASVATIGLAATIALVRIDAVSMQHDIDSEFALVSHESTTRLEATVDLGKHAIEGLAGGFASTRPHELSDFWAIADKLAAFGLGIQALEWIPIISAGERASFEAQMARQWGKPYHVFERRNGNPVDVTLRPDYFPVAFVTPLKGNEAAVGYDLASNPAREAALVKARDDGTTVATAGVKLVQNNQMGVLLFTPVYTGDAPTATVEQRRAALKGFALGVFSVPDLLAVALRTSDTSLFRYRLVDETDPSSPIELASDESAKPNDRLNAPFSLFASPPPLDLQSRVRIADRDWTLHLTPTPAFVAKYSDYDPYWLLIGGIVLTELAIGYVMVIADRQRRLADSRERDLENQIFALDQHAIVSITDTQGVITYANDRFCQISGFERAALIGANHNIVNSGAQQSAFYRNLWTTLRLGEVWRGEICNRNAAGELYWLDATIVPLTDRQGRFQKFIAICTEVTARKRLEQELESSRAFLQSVTDSMGEGVYTLDTKGRCTFLNAEAERLIGWSFAEARGRILHDLVHFQDACGGTIPACECSIMRRLGDVSKYSSEDQVFTHRDGRIFPVSIIAVRLERDGVPNGSVVVFQDITERRRVQRELEESERRLSIALSASSTGMWDYDPINNRGIYSDTWFRMLGYEPRPGAQNGDLFMSLLHPADRERYFETLEQHGAGETVTVEVEFRMRRANGEWAWIRSIGKIIERDATGRPARSIGIHIDTTAAHQIQSELADAKDVAVRASQAKSEFLATMSHEIRTPMNAIIGLSHLFARTEMNPRQRDYLTKIQNASQALLAIINDILDFSKIEAGKLTIESVAFELDKMIEGVATVINPKILEKGLKLVVERKGELPSRFVGDPLRLSQVLTNLLSNATKFTARGEVRVKLGGAQLGDEYFRLEISVTDSGIGMTEEQMALLFRPFTQADASTSRRFGGTGLGLAICRRIMELMGGEISVTSVEGQGSTFTFSAPLKIGASPELAEQERVALTGRRVLVVEDSKSTQRMLRASLVEWGMEVEEAPTGLEALQRLEGSKPFDIVLLDWKLPDVDGIETLARMRAAGAAPAAIMLTAYGRVELAEALANRFGAAAESIAALDKPARPQLLKEKVLAALGQQRNVTSSAAPADRQASDVLLPGFNILIVEDNPINQQVATELLEALGVETSVASSGEEALGILATRKFDLILMDMQMPGKDGLETTIAIRTEIGDTLTPILAMTANAMAGDRERCLEAGMNDHIPKPIDPDKLALTLAHWLNAPARPAGAQRPEQPAARTEAGAASPGLDVDFALKNLAGNVELYDQLLEMFIDEHRDQASVISQAIENGDWKRANALAHGLKGAASTLGALSVAESARVIEQGAREETPDAESLAAEAETLRGALTEVIETIAARQAAANEAPGPDEPAPNAAALLQIIDALAKLLKEGDADAETEAERLALSLKQTAAALRASSIAASASRYDFGSAADALVELRQEISNWS